MDARNAVARKPEVWIVLAVIAGAGLGCTSQQGAQRTASGKSLSLAEFSPALSGTPAQFVVATPETKAIAQAENGATTDASTPDTKDLVASPGSPFSGIGASSGTKAYYLEIGLQYSSCNFELLSARAILCRLSLAKHQSMLTVISSSKSDSRPTVDQNLRRRPMAASIKPRCQVAIA